MARGAEVFEHGEDREARALRPVDVVVAGGANQERVELPLRALPAGARSVRGACPGGTADRLPRVQHRPAVHAEGLLDREASGHVREHEVAPGDAAPGEHHAAGKGLPRGQDRELCAGEVEGRAGEEQPGQRHGRDETDVDGHVRVHAHRRRVAIEVHRGEAAGVVQGAVGVRDVESAVGETVPRAAHVQGEKPRVAGRPRGDGYLTGGEASEAHTISRSRKAATRTTSESSGSPWMFSTTERSGASR